DWRSARSCASGRTTPARPARSSRTITCSPAPAACRHPVCRFGGVSVAGDLDYANPSTMAAPGGHYSHAVTAGGLVFVSGQLPIAPNGSKLSEASFEQQAQQVLDKVAHSLKAAGSSIDKLAQVRVYITDITLWPTFNAIYAKWAGSARPARCVVPVPQLHYGVRSRSRPSRFVDRHSLTLAQRAFISRAM